jgi:hypothetical protein
MLRRVLISALLALCLVLTGLGTVVAQTRMAMADGYCGADSLRIVLDAAGLPLLDGDGAAIEAPDCPACTIQSAAMPDLAPDLHAPATRIAIVPPAGLRHLHPRQPQQGGAPRGPPYLA